MRRATARAVVLLLLLLRGPAAQAQELVTESVPIPLTPGEEEEWFAPTTPQEAVDYLERLKRAFPQIVADTLLLASGEPAEADSSLPVHVIVVPGRHSVDAREKDAPVPERLRVLVLAAQRGDEFAGLEVSLRMMRDLASGALPDVSERLDVAFIPAVNPWGLLWWVREEPSGVDPARDHAMLRSASQRAIHEFVAAWRPHMVIELREFGPEVYRVQVGLPTHPNVDPQLVRYGRFYLLPYVTNELAKSSISFRERITVDPEPADRAPLIRGAESLPPGAFFTPGALGADRARNSFALGGSLGLMLGVASLDGAEGLSSRVELQYRALKALLEVTGGRSAELFKRTAVALAAGGKPSAGNEMRTDRKALTLRSRYVQDTSQPQLTWLVWSEYGTIMTQTTDRWRSVVRRELALPTPAAWLIDAEAPEWADLLKTHGFEVERLTKNTRMAVGGYPVGLPEFLPPSLSENLPPDEAPDASALLVRAEKEFAAGSWVVRSSQSRVRLLFTLLEPWSQDAPLSASYVPPYSEATEGQDRYGGDSFLYPVYRIDEKVLSRLRTEMPDHASARARGR